MRKAAKKAAEHPTLSQESVSKLLSTQAKTLTPWDILSMERAEAEVVQAQLMLERISHQKTQLVASLQKREAQWGEYEQQLREAAKRARLIADKIADEYGVSWQTHTYSPETGAIAALPAS